MAQRVLYSPTVANPAIGFEVLGKAGDFYWLQKSKKKLHRKKPADASVIDNNTSFEIYNERMKLVNAFTSSIPGTIIKKYFLAADGNFDQLTFTRTNNKITALLSRYSATGESLSGIDTLYNFPPNMRNADFLLVRSADKARILLLGFEPVHDSPPRVYAISYDKNWKRSFETILSDPNISQPYVQYEPVNYPLENFDNSPVKVANNGDWLMLSPSATSGNYLLMHFHTIDHFFEYREIQLPENKGVKELGLSLDNNKQEAIAGILLNTTFQSVKKVVTAQYMFSQCRLSFDSSYLLNTLAGNKTRNENIVEEYFMAVPGKGFMLLKEYGRPFVSFDPDPQRANSNYVSAERFKVINNRVLIPVNEGDYTRYTELAGTRGNYERGDLSLYFFPAGQGESSWSGLLNKQQLNELNLSYLSYIFIPIEGKLIFLYNSVPGDSNYQYSTSTVLDREGKALNEGLVFWKARNTLLFQKARQITANELAIPYERNMSNGFAIVRL